MALRGKRRARRKRRSRPVAHHCGAGTTAAALRAGILTVGVPHFSDQHFWAQRVRSLGVGPEPIVRGALTVERLAAAIASAVTDDGIRERAQTLGERIRAEDGVAAAVSCVEQHYEASRA